MRADAVVQVPPAYRRAHKLGFKDIQDLTPGTKVYIGPDGSATHFVGQLIVDHSKLIDGKLLVETLGGGTMHHQSVELMDGVQGQRRSRFDAFLGEKGAAGDIETCTSDFSPDAN